MIFASTKERLLQFIEYKDIKLTDFFKNTGIKRGFLDSDKLKSVVSDIFIAKIIATYPDVNLEWLITGKGDMLKRDNAVEEPGLVYKLKTDRVVSEQAIPLYSIEASAGVVTLFRDSNQQKPIDFIQVPNLPKCDGAVYVTGDSMYPLLKSGDIVMYKQMHDIENGLIWGEMYLLSIDYDGDEIVSVKWLHKSEKGENYIRLVSENRHHPDRDIPLARVRALALVKASIRINSMS